MAKNEKKSDDKIIFAWIASFFTIIGFLIALLTKKDDNYVMFYAKQGLVLFIGQIIILICSGIFSWMTKILWIFWAILWIISWINALSGEKRNSFVVGDLAEKIKI